MAAGTLILYNSFSEFAQDGTIDLDSHTFKGILLTSAYTPDLTHSTLANVSANEIAGANGYTTGGQALQNVTWTRAAGVATFDSDNLVWNATGGSITAHYLIVYDDTAANDELVGYGILDDTPADVVATAGNTFTVGPNATTGWFTHTVNPA